MASDHETATSGFYDDQESVAAYLAHRHSGAASPNTVMEEPAFLAELGSIDGQRVVDLGCGDGSTATLLSERGAASYLGIDGSAAMIAEATVRYGENPHVAFEWGAIAALDLPAESIDLVVSRMAFHGAPSCGTTGPSRTTSTRSVWRG